MRILLSKAYVYQHGKLKRADVVISGGRIESVGTDVFSSAFDAVFSLQDKVLIPGFVDVHVHLREPGFLYKETIATGTLAAAHGGYTAVCAMPNLVPPPDTLAHLSVQQSVIERDALVHVYPYAAITMGQKGEGTLADIEALAPHVVGFSDDGRGVQDEDLMRAAMQRVRAAGSRIVAHCEDNHLLHGGYIHDGEYAHKHGHRGISSESEWRQVQRDLALVRETTCPYHVCHVSTWESVALIHEAKREGLPVTCETAPHYLTMCDSDLQENGRFKMNPPIRSMRDRDALLEGLTDGTIDMIATDHAPHSEMEKAQGLEKSLMGVVGLETAFPVLYTHLVKEGILTLDELLRIMCDAPRKLFGLPGGIEVGEEADLAVLDLNTSYVIDPNTFLSKGRATPFAGWKVLGENVMTLMGGKIVWQKQ